MPRWDPEPSLYDLAQGQGHVVITKQLTPAKQQGPTQCH